MMRIWNHNTRSSANTDDAAGAAPTGGAITTAGAAAAAGVTAEGASQPEETQRVPLRSEIAAEYKWRLEDIFTDDESWARERAELAAEFPKLAAFHGAPAKSAAALLACLKAQDAFFSRCETLYAYAKMRRDEDNANDKYQAFTDIAMSLITEALAAASYIVPEILAAGRARIDAYLAESAKSADTAELVTYAHYFDDLFRQQEHILPEREEAILALAGDPLGAADDIYTMFTNADLKFPDVKDERGNLAELSEGRYVRFLESGDRGVRERAFHTLYDTYSTYRNTLAASLSASVKKERFLSNVRKYGSAIEMNLDADRVPVALYDRLIEAVDGHLGLLHRYLRLRKRALGLSELRMYDLYTPIVPAADRRIAYEDAVSLVKEGLLALGPRYSADLARALSSGWIDVFENVNKTRGAYSWGTYRSHPYILLNYQSRIDDVLTLAHEIGHSMHSYYTNRTQPYIYSEYKIFVAEVASTVNESLMLNYLIGAAKDETEKAYLLNRQLETIRGTLFRQTMFAEFERTVHKKAQEGEALTPDTLSEVYKALNDKYFAKEVAVDGRIALEWARIPHFYRPFYVYQYATGISAAIFLTERIRAEGREAVDRYMEFLSSGGGDYPLLLLSRAGVDLTSPAPVEGAMRAFEAALAELEKLV
ncbi:MAG: oligoendopeptidase F [Clostridiales bacterium]|jgi:oligoendopeptidase F|nr:oligoendopeptidase F [Clostridiales bacterium]